MRKIIVAKQTGKNSYKSCRRYVLEKSEIAGLIIGIIAAGYIAARILIG